MRIVLLAIASIVAGAMVLSEGRILGGDERGDVLVSLFGTQDAGVLDKLQVGDADEPAPPVRSY